MPRLAQFENTTFEFPDDSTDDDILGFIKNHIKAPEWSTVRKSIPGTIKRGVTSVLAGGAQALGDVTGYEPLKQSAQQALKGIRLEAQEETPPNMTIPQEALVSGVSSAAQVLPVAGLTALSGPVGWLGAAGRMTSVMGGQTALTRYGQLRDEEKFTPGRSAVHAAFEGLVEKYTEYFPAKEIGKNLLLKEFSRYFTKEMIGEQVATVLQDLSAKLSDRPDMTIGDFARDLAVTAIATPIGGGVQYAAMKGVSAVANGVTAAGTPPQESQADPISLSEPATSLSTLLQSEAGQVGPTAPLTASTPTPPPTSEKAANEATQPEDQRVKVLTSEAVVPPAVIHERVYAAVPETDAPEQVVATPNRGAAEALVRQSPGTKLVYFDATPDEFRAMTAAASETVLLDRESLDPAGGYVVDTKKLSPRSIDHTTTNVQQSPFEPTPVSEQFKIKRGTKGTVTVNFNAKHLKALYHLGAMMEKQDTSTKTPTKTIMLFMANLVSMLQDSEGRVRERAQIYYEAVKELVRAQPKGDQSVSAPNEALAQRDYVNRTYNPPNGLRPGEVALRDGLMPTDNIKQAQAYLTRWLRGFLPEAKIVIAGEALAGSTASVAYYNGVHYILIPRAMMPGQNNTLWKAKWLFYLAHEFGHIIFNQRIHAQENAQYLFKLKEEHRDLVSRVPSMTVEQFVQAWYGPAWVIRLNADRKNRQLYGIGADEPASLMVAEVDRLKGNTGYTLSFEEWMAEQFARHVNQEGNLRDKTPLWVTVYMNLKDFFDRVVRLLAPTRTYKQFVESLRTAPSVEGGLPSTGLIRNDSPMEDARIKEEFEYTTKVLDRLPNKERIKRASILQQLPFMDEFGKRKGPADVREQEAKLIREVLDEMPGDTVDRADFQQAVLSRVVPLRTAITDRYASYGVQSLGYSPYLPTVNTDLTPTYWPDSGMENRVPVYTRIYNVPFETGGSGHFAGFPNYYAHVRAINLFEDGKNIRTVIEIQSDREQHEKALTNKERVELVRELADIRRLEGLLKGINRDVSQSPAAAFQTLAILNDFLYNGPATLGYSTVRAERLEESVRRWQETVGRWGREDDVTLLQHIDRELNNLRLRADEYNTLLSKRSDLSSMPKNWEQLVLLSEMQKATKEGAEVLRIPGSDETVAAVEGYEATLPIQAVIDTFALNNEDTPKNGEIDARPVMRKDGKVMGAVWRGLRNHTVEYATQNENEVEALTKALVYPPEQQTILRRYRDLAKFARTTLGGREVTTTPHDPPDRVTADTFGFKWIEIPLKPERATMPITYYSMAESIDDQISGAERELNAVDPELPKAVRGMGRMFTKLLQLNQMAKLWPTLEGLQTYRKLMQDLHALKSKLFEGPNKQLHNWYKLPAKQSELTETALLAEVNSGAHWTQLVQDPATGQWIHVLGDEAKREMSRLGLTAQAQDQVVAVKNDFLTTLQVMEKVLTDNLTSFFADSPGVLKQRLAENTVMFNDLRAKPYLPDTRFGRWKVEVRAGYDQEIDGALIKKGDLVRLEKFDTRPERNRALVQMKREYAEHVVAGGYESDFVAPFSGLPGEFLTHFVEEMSLSDSTRLSPEQLEALQELAFYQTRTGKFAQYLKTPKKNLGGASRNLRRVYAAYHWKSANAIAKMKYNSALRKAIASVKEEARNVRRSGVNSDSIDQMYEYLGDNYRHVMHPENDWPRFRSFVALWYLFASVKTALMNFTSVPVLSYPYLAARHGDVAAVAALTRSMRDVALYWKNPNKLSADRQRVLQKASEDGVTNQSLASIMASVADGGVGFERIMPKYAMFGNRHVSDFARRSTWKILSMGMAPFQAIEQLNRQITLLAAYDLESSKTGHLLSSGNTASYDAAREAVDVTQNEFSSWNQPKFMWGGKAVFFLFYSFVQNMSVFMFGGDKGWWRALLVLAAMGGLLALPGAENLIDILNYAWRKWSGQHQDLRVEAREVFDAIGINPDFAMHGLAHNIFGLGWDVSSSVGQGRIIPGTDAIFGIGEYEARVVQAAGEIGGPAGGMFMAFMQALADDNPNPLLRLNKALPAFMKNLGKAANALVEGEFQDPKGRAVVDAPTPLEVAGQAAGFRPTRLAERQELIRIQRDAAVFYTERRANLMEMFYSAKKNGNAEVLADVREAISKFNREVPAPQLAIRLDDLARSVQSRSRIERQVEAGQAPQVRYRQLMELLSETYQGAPI